MPNINSISALLQAMKEYTAKLAFRSEQGMWKFQLYIGSR